MITWFVIHAAHLGLLPFDLAIRPQLNTSILCGFFSNAATTLTFDLFRFEFRMLLFCCVKMREHKEMENLAKLYLTDVIRRECWDDMLVKGRGLVVSRSRHFPFSLRNAV